MNEIIAHCSQCSEEPPLVIAGAGTMKCPHCGYVYAWAVITADAENTEEGETA